MYQWIQWFQCIEILWTYHIISFTVAVRSVHIFTYARQRCWSFLYGMDPISRSESKCMVYPFVTARNQKSWDNARGHHMPAELSWWWSLTISSWRRIFPNCLHTVTIFASRTTCLLHPKICSWYSWSCWYSTTGQPWRVRCREPGSHPRCHCPPKTWEGKMLPQFLQ